MREHLTIPNGLTLLRLLVVPFFVVASLRGEFTVALVLFVGAALTDVLDGYLARRLDQRSKVGAILDPAADKSLMLIGYVIYTIDGIARYRLPVWLSFTVFARDLCIVMFAYLLYTRVRVRRFPPSVSGKISTLLQVVTLSATIAMNTGLELLIRPILAPLFVITLIGTLVSGFDYLRRSELMLIE